jgi:hypothetical protein
MIGALNPLRQRFFAVMKQLEQDGDATAKAIADHLNEELAKNAGVIDVSFVIHAEALQKAGQEVRQRFQEFGADAGGTFADAIGAAFAGIGSGEGFFKAFGNTLLQGLGSIFLQMGKALLVYGLAMEGLLPALLNPFTSGPAAIAAGAALIALGGLLGGIASGKGRSSRSIGGGGSFSSLGQSTPSSVTLSPRPATTYTQGYSAQPIGGGSRGTLATPQQPLVFNFTVFGPRDPSVSKMIADAAQRGVEMGAGRPTYGRRGIG